MFKNKSPLYHPSVKIPFIPDIGMRVRRDGYSYRINSWIKAVPVRFKSTENHYVGRVFEELMHETPSWNTRYKLEFCTRDEATHVSASGVCGVIAWLADSNFEFSTEYVNWSQELLDELKESALRLVGMHCDGSLNGAAHSLWYPNPFNQLIAGAI